MLHLTRRKIIASSAILLSSATMKGHASIAPNGEQNSLYDFQKPQDNLDAFVKVMGDQSGKEVWIAAQGQIYALREGEMPIPIMGVEGVRWTKFTKTESGYLMSTRDWSFYKDLETDKALDFFDNPFTGERNQTRHILTGVNDWPMTPERGQEVPNFEGDAWLLNKPFLIPWKFHGEDVSVPLELLVKYANGAAGGEWMNFMTTKSELNDPNISSTNTRLQWTGHSGWVRWMNMGDIKGRTLWSSMGRKLSSVDELRPEFIDLAEHYFPGSIKDPIGYKKTSYTVSPPEVISKKPE